MNITEEIKTSTANFLEKQFNFQIDASQLQVDPTRKEFKGDFTLVVFPLVKAMRNSPEKAGELLGEHLKTTLKEVESFNVIKGFLNIELSSDYWVKALAQSLKSEQWLKPAASNELVLVEFSSPNTNKPLHLGHLRNNFLGFAVSKLNAFAGKKVIKTQIINDRGVHICKSMLAWQMHSDGETPELSGLKGDKLVGKYYVLYDKHYRAQVAKLQEDGLSEEDAKREAPLQKAVQAMLVKWEEGDEDVRALWQRMNQWVYNGFDATYHRMGVSFDKLYFESDTYSKGKDIVLAGLEKGVFYKKDNGSIWVDLTEHGLDEKLLVRADGTTVYMTQDIGTAVQRFEDYPALSQVIYTVGDEQDYHFKVLFLVLEKLGYKWAPACRHLSYGMVDLPSGKMKSREGTVVDADDLMQEVVEAAKTSSLEKGKLDEMSDEEQNQLFEILGIGALKFFLLRVDPKKRMMFNPEESVSLQGDTGPFVQYTYARCKAVLRKAGAFNVSDASAVLEDKERQLVRHLTEFRTLVYTAAQEMNPAEVANYCLDLAKLFNQFYHEAPILKAEGAMRDFRLGVTELTANTLKTALDLLGINVPERM